MHVNIAMRYIIYKFCIYLIHIRCFNLSCFNLVLLPKRKKIYGCRNLLVDIIRHNVPAIIALNLFETELYLYAFPVKNCSFNQKFMSDSHCQFYFLNTSKNILSEINLFASQ